MLCGVRVTRFTAVASRQRIKRFGSSHCESIYSFVLPNDCLNFQPCFTNKHWNNTLTSRSPCRLFTTNKEDIHKNTHDEKGRDSSSSNGEEINIDNKKSTLIYEGALGGLTTKLKRISVTSCILGIVGLPTASILYGIEAPAAAQAAVGGTALIAAVGSTVALHFCFSPYVHMLELVPKQSATGEGADLIKATTRNILTMKVETIFNPETDVTPNTSSRPFCNFIAKGVPMYVHPELIEDKRLSMLLFGEIETKDEANKKDDDDLF